MNLSTLFSLAGKSALITGASSGSGLHRARTLAQAGARVVLAARRKSKLDIAVADLSAAGHRAYAVELDVTDAASIESAMKESEQLLDQPLDILVNNAGVLHVEKFLEEKADAFDRVFDTNYRGAFLVAQHAARRMAGRGGSIINIASTAGLRAAGHLSSYASSKAALIQLTHVMALELASKGIRVNAICPGNILTDMHAVFEETGLDQSVLKRIPMRSFGEPHHLDGATLLLASNAGAYMTGAVIPVDGGQLLAWL
jgi:NAD(P)-dependent dehydrogenase (short-subunit alcohol dehydrogenase family)